MHWAYELRSMAQIALFIGSVRRDRQGIKVARWMEEKLIARGHTVYFIDPLELNLPLLDRMYKEMENPSSVLRDLQNKIKNADGYLAVTPEYNHSTSAAMKTLYTISWKNTFSNLQILFHIQQEVLAESMLLNICG